MRVIVKHTVTMQTLRFASGDKGDGKRSAGGQEEGAISKKEQENNKDNPYRENFTNFTANTENLLTSFKIEDTFNLLSNPLTLSYKDFDGKSVTKECYTSLTYQDLEALRHIESNFDSSNKSYTEDLKEYMQHLNELNAINERLRNNDCEETKKLSFLKNVSVNGSVPLFGFYPLEVSLLKNLWPVPIALLDSFKSEDQLVDLIQAHTKKAGEFSKDIHTELEELDAITNMLNSEQSDMYEWRDPLVSYVKALDASLRLFKTSLENLVERSTPVNTAYETYRKCANGLYQLTQLSHFNSISMACLLVKKAKKEQAAYETFKKIKKALEKDQAKSSKIPPMQLSEDTVRKFKQQLKMRQGSLNSYLSFWSLCGYQPRLFLVKDGFLDFFAENIRYFLNEKYGEWDRFFCTVPMESSADGEIRIYSRGTNESVTDRVTPRVSGEYQLIEPHPYFNINTAEKLGKSSQPRWQHFICEATTGKELISLRKASGLALKDLKGDEGKAESTWRDYENSIKNINLEDIKHNNLNIGCTFQVLESYAKAIGLSFFFLLEAKPVNLLIANGSNNKQDLDAKEKVNLPSHPFEVSELNKLWKSKKLNDYSLPNREALTLVLPASTDHEIKINLEGAEEGTSIVKNIGEEYAKLISRLASNPLKAHPDRELILRVFRGSETSPFSNISNTENADIDLQSEREIVESYIFLMSRHIKNSLKTESVWLFISATSRSHHGRLGILLLMRPKLFFR